VLRHPEELFPEDLVTDDRIQAGMACRCVRIPPILVHEAGLREGGGAVDIHQDVDGVEHLLGQVAELGSHPGSDAVVQVIFSLPN